MSSEANKVSGSAIMDRLDKIVEATGPLGLAFNPRPLIIYKPNLRGDLSKGGAIKMNYYVRPKVVKDFVRYEGAFWLELVPQVKSDNEYPKFDWKNEETVLSVKFGLPDLSAFLLGYREFRGKGLPVPTAVRPIVKGANGWGPTDKPNEVGLVHKFGDQTTQIRWAFDPERGSLLTVSRGKGVMKTVSMTLAEEVQVVSYLQAGLDALVKCD